MTHHISRDGVAAVDPDYFWRPIATCPHTVKVQLLSRYGVATYGQYHGEVKSYWTHWAPLPKKRPE